MVMKSKKSLTDIELAGMHFSGRSYGFIGPKRIYLDYGIPGERVDATNVRREGDYLRGGVSAVCNAADGRTKPFCRHFGVCGGCAWQHISYDAQLEFKRRILSDAFKKHGIALPEIPLPVPAPSTFNFRHRLDYSFSSRRWYHEGEGKVTDPVQRIALGFHPADNPFKVLDIGECFLQDQPSRRIYDWVKSYTLLNSFSYFDPKEKTGLMRQLSIRINRQGEAMVILAITEDDYSKMADISSEITNQIPEVISFWYSVIPDIRQSWQEGKLWHLSGSEFLTETANGLTFRIHPCSFYQPNPAQAERIFARIRKIADLKGQERVYDLYSGIGTLSLSVADLAGEVIGIEGSAHATSDAVHNARVNGFGNCNFITGDVLETFTPEFIRIHGKPDLVILDPPRSGTLIEIKKTILESAPVKIIYLSCDPLSLARDLKMFTQGYSVSYIQPFDQFPHTHHLETLVMLEKQQFSN